MNTKHFIPAWSTSLGLLTWLVFCSLQPTVLAQALDVPKPPVPDGYRLVEGDIQVPIDPTFGLVTPAAVFPPDPGLLSERDYWPNGEVFYEFDDNVNQANRQAMLQAMAVWEGVARLTFKPKGSLDFYYLHIQNSTENSSPVGRQRITFKSTINISSWGSTYQMVHELGHTLGLWHEQSRSDRNSYIRINSANILPGREIDFEVRNEALHYGPYDFDSVMHYDQFASSANGLPTITVLPPYDVQWQNRIGQLTHLSYWDSLVMSLLYPQPDWRFVDQAADNDFCRGGTFFDPYKYFFCGTVNVPSGGTVWIQPGRYPGHVTYTKRMTWKAPLGGVTIY